MMRVTVKAVVMPIAVVLVLSAMALAQGRGGRPNGGGGGVDHTAPQDPPIQLGTSGGNAKDIANGYCSSGTLGALLKDSGAPTPRYYILSNAHVLAHDIAASSEDPDTADIGDDISQPGLIDTRCGFDPSIWVADLASQSSLNTSPFSNVDVAVGEVVMDGGVPRVSSDGAILEIGRISSTTASAVPGQRVKKSGRTTGLTKSQVDSINAQVSVQYDDESNGTPFIRVFTGQIVIKNRGSKFLNAGDSGSVMVEDVNTNPRPIGLLYAGSSLIAVANPIDEVLAYLNDDETLVNAASKPLSFVGAPSLGASQPQPTGVARAIAVQAANADRLSAIPGSVGHAVSVINGVAIIKVLVEQITVEARRALPDQLDGVPVLLEEVGRIVAF